MGGEMVAAHFSLLKTVIGTGIVSYVSFFTVFGIVYTVIFSCVAAVLMGCALIMLCECASFYGNRQKTYSSALEEAWPNGAKYFNLVVFVKCFGVSISYLLILRTLLQYIAQSVLGIHSVSAEMLVIAYGLCLFPICIMKDMKSLRYTSALGIFGVYVCIAGSVYNYIQEKQRRVLPDIDIVKPVSIKWLRRVGQFTFSFTCHQNIFSIRAGITNPTTKAMSGVVGSVMASALLLYLLFSIIIYKTYGDSVTDNALEAFADGNVKKGVYVFYTILLTCSYPLQVYPARDCLCEWESALVRPENRTKTQNTIVRIALTALIMCAGIGITFMRVPLTTIQAMIGGTASTVMCNVIPSICMMKLPRKKRVWEKCAVAMLLAYGAIAFIGACCVM